MMRTLFLFLLASTSGANLTVKGSDTIGGELGPALAHAYEASHPEVRIRWEALGSATAFQGLFDGSADLGASSRPIEAKELQQASELRIELKEYVLGYDGIAVVVNPQNRVTQLTVDQLSDVFTGRARTWAEVGGADVPIRVLSRPSYSGTHSFFKAKVLRRDRKEATDEFAPRTEFIEKNEDLVRQVARDPAAVAYVGMGWLRAGLSVVAVSPMAGKPYLLPTTDTVRKGEYPIHRALLLYTRGQPNGELSRFLAFALGEDGRRIVAANDFTPSDAAGHQSEPVAQPVAAKPVRRPRTYRVPFDYGKATIGPEALTTLKAIRADALRLDARLVVVGNADALGNAEVNRRMAQIRATRVAERLIRMGIPRADVSVDVHGSDTPLASNASAAGRRENRRVDIDLVPRR